MVARIGALKVQRLDLCTCHLHLRLYLRRIAQAGDMCAILLHVYLLQPPIEMYPVVQIEIDPLDTPGGSDHWHRNVAIHQVDIAGLFANMPDVIPALFEIDLQQAIWSRYPCLRA